MRILVTRPAEDGAEIARLLADMGHEGLLAPLLTVQIFDGPKLTLDGVQAVLATSANGVRALAARSDARDLPLFAVGPQTADAAARAGFVRIRNAGGDAAALANAIPGWADPIAGALLHVAGAESGGGLAEALAAKGFTVRRENLYRVDAAARLPDTAVRALEDRSIQAALFFSPRSAAIFADRVAQAGLPTAGMTAVCISAKTADALRGLSFADIRIAAAPHQAALLACL
ncbi:MAG: uroporphyrinogen-III synthase [Alphaproteobacteria bacterium]|nr:uroporphyrinogen-III synthase [Alphaproteobacteria bacterium]